MKEEEEEEKASAIEEGLEELAKKMPKMFEPARSEGRERPLIVNLDLALYRAKVLARTFNYQQAEALLLKAPTYLGLLVSLLYY